MQNIQEWFTRTRQQSKMHTVSISNWLKWKLRWEAIEDFINWEIGIAGTRATSDAEFRLFPANVISR